jgi:hypothetical protein
MSNLTDTIKELENLNSLSEERLKIYTEIFRNTGNGCRDIFLYLKAYSLYLNALTGNNSKKLTFYAFLTHVTSKLDFYLKIAKTEERKNKIKNVFGNIF